MMKFFQVQCLVWALSHVLDRTWSILDSAPTKYDSNSGFSRISFGSRCTHHTWVCSALASNPCLLCNNAVPMIRSYHWDAFN